MTRHQSEQRKLAARYAMHAANERRSVWIVLGWVVVSLAIMLYCFCICLMSAKPWTAAVSFPSICYFLAQIPKRWRAAQQRSDEYLQLRQEALEDE